MMEFDFYLKYQLADSFNDPTQVVEALGEAGCDDATIGIGLPGRVGLMFAREAESAVAALQSALADVKKALPGAKLIEVGPDFVGLSEVADMAKMSRQNLRHLMTNNASFPPPTHDGTTGMWHLSDLLTWLKEKQYKVDDVLLEVALATRLANAAKEVLLLSFDTPNTLNMYASLFESTIIPVKTEALIRS